MTSQEPGDAAEAIGEDELDDDLGEPLGGQVPAKGNVKPDRASSPPPPPPPAKPARP